MNPKEGELRPQLLDRFGLSVLVQGIADRNERVLVMEFRVAFDEDPVGFSVRWAEESRKLAERIERARELYPRVSIERRQLFAITDFCLEVGVDGHRGDIIMMKAAKALAAFDGLAKVEKRHVGVAAKLALPHRMRRRPLMEMGDNVNKVRKLRQKVETM